MLLAIRDGTLRSDPHGIPLVPPKSSGYADGIIDISPFTCMNGIVSEALYPRQSQEHAGIPIKNFYFDGKGEDMTDDLEIFLELARTYQRRKPHPRRYPPWFG
jgi:hypothetical protein